MKNVLIISTTPRVEGNSESMARWFEAGAIDAGNKTTFVKLVKKNISFCKGCMKCFENQRCVIEDDAREICDLMFKADVVVWATPIYFHNVCGQMKTMMDRTNAIYGSEYRFTEVYLLASGAEDKPTTTEGAIRTVQGWVDCFERATFKKMLFIGNVRKKCVDRQMLDPCYQAGLKV